MAEFTGERVVPGLVDDDLFNEHAARYRFAARVAARLGGTVAVLDAGCGTGYGSALFDGPVTSIDVAADALRYARESYPKPRYVQASADTLPFADASFDLICAFEVIEHLEGWADLLTESRRVLKPGGMLLVSTPNKAYYTEVRAKVGPNPFHTHEFEYAEFRDALKAVFPYVRMWSQNHAASVVFAPVEPDRAEIDASGDTRPENAHFFIAACGAEEIPVNDLYAWIPSSGNVLRERERHIAKLEAELAEKNRWLERRAEEHSRLHAEHERTLAELEEQAVWAKKADADLDEARGVIRDLQNEANERLEWVRVLEARIDTGDREIARLNAHREELETELTKRTQWGFALDAEVESLNAQLKQMVQHNEQLTATVEQLQNELRLVAQSKWIRLGRKLNLGPQVG